LFGGGPVGARGQARPVRKCITLHGNTAGAVVTGGALDVYARFAGRIVAVTTKPGPGLRRRQLAGALEVLRKRAGKTQGDAASVIDCARSRIAQFESARVVPRMLDLRELVHYYGGADQLETLEELRRQAHERGWWAVYKLPTWLQSYISLENDATTIQCFALELVPGLLQTEPYARETYQRHQTPAHDLDRFVSARMERRRRVGVDQTLSVVMSEALLHRTSCIADVGAEQLAHLHAMAIGVVGVTIRVLPFAAGWHASMDGSFTLLTFPDGLADPVAYQLHSAGGQLVDDQVVVSALDVLYSELAGQALDEQASAELIARFAGLG
jgi:DNA-binding XRE family transcriptional regulator